MNNPSLAIAIWNQTEYSPQCQQLANHLQLALIEESNPQFPPTLLLTYRQQRLVLLTADSLNTEGLFVKIEPRYGEQYSYPAAKKGILAQALGRCKTIIDATTGWGQDSLAIFRMGYSLQCIERSPIMHALLSDGFQQLAQQSWFIKAQLHLPPLIKGNAIELLPQITQADCIYLDPMFPPKPKMALAKKPIQILQQLIGEDIDKHELFAIAKHCALKRVVIKSPDYAPPLVKNPSFSLHSKLIRYDIYLK
ncbi:MAG: hypothetical protein RL637_33 [Pseudomonadota bacterium]|jgi:16S rRNA (guanine1516-N2)-methyltransferase